MRGIGLFACGAVFATTLASAQTPITPGTPISGALTADDATNAEGHHQDEYVLQARAGQQLNLTLWSEAFDPLLIVTGPEDFRAEDDDSGDGLNAQLSFAVPHDGEYRIAATSYSEGAGGYLLTIRDQAARRPSRLPTLMSDASPIAIGQSINGALTEDDAQRRQGSYADSFTFEGQAGQQVEITMRSGAFESALLLIGPDNVTYEHRDRNARINARLPFTGRYQIQASTYEYLTGGEYTLSLTAGETNEVSAEGVMVEASLREDGDGGRVLPFDLRINGELPAGAGERSSDVYTFRGRARQQFQISLSPSTDVEMKVTGPGRFERTTAIDRSDTGSIAVALPRTGAYRVEITGRNTSGGAYQLAARSLDTNLTPISLRAGEERTGTLAHGDVRDDENGVWADAYTLSGDAGDRFTLRLNASRFTPYLVVTGPNEFYAQAVGESGEALVVLTLPEDGDYRVSASAVSPDSPGDYRLSVASGVVAYEALAPDENESRYSGVAKDLSEQDRNEEAAIVTDAFLARLGSQLPHRWDDYIKGQLALADYLMQAGHPEDSEQVIDHAVAAIQQIARTSHERLVVASQLAFSARIIGNSNARDVVVRFASGAGRPDEAEIRSACVALTRATLNVPLTEEAEPYPSCEADAAREVENARSTTLGTLGLIFRETVLYTNQGGDFSFGELTIPQTRRVTSAIADTMQSVAGAEGLHDACALGLELSWHTDWGDERCRTYASPSWLTGVTLVDVDIVAAEALADAHKSEIEASYDQATAYLDTLDKADARGLGLILSAHLRTCDRSRQCAQRRVAVELALIRSAYSMRDHAVTLSRSDAYLASRVAEPASYGTLLDQYEVVRVAAMAAASARGSGAPSTRHEQKLDAEFERYVAGLESVVPTLEFRAQEFWNPRHLTFLLETGRPDLLLVYAERGLAIRSNTEDFVRHYWLLTMKAQALGAMRRYREAVATAHQADALYDPAQIWQENVVVTTGAELAQYEIALALASGDGDLSREEGIDVGFQAAQRALSRNAGDTYAWTALALTAEAQGGRGALDALRNAWVRQQANRREGASRSSAANLWIGASATQSPLPLSEDARRQLERDLSQRVPDWRAVFAPPALSIAEIREHLRPGETLLLLWADADTDRAWVAAISATDTAFVEASLGARALEHEVASLRSGLCIDACAEDTARGFFDRDRSYRLYQALFGDPRVQSILAASQELAIVPSGRFNSLPFNTLVTAQPEGLNDDPVELRRTIWLGLEKAIEVVPSVQLFAQARQQRRNDGAPNERYLGVAPSFSGLATGEGSTTANALAALPELIHAQDEVRTQAERLGGGANVLLVGSSADETSLRQALANDRFRVVTFATHAFVSNELNGLTFEPAIALAPGGASSETDGLLTASEIAQLRLDGAFVILSACNTAAGGRAGGNGLSGLSRAVLLAGARTLMVTHWAVRDDAANRISVATLEIQRANPDITAAEALRRAMRALVDDASGDDDELTLADPAVWAPFMIVGASSAGP